MAVVDAKEDVVLQLTYRVLAQIANLRAELAQSFERNVDTDKAVEGKPAISNVLDECIENLQIARSRIDEMTKFVVCEIINKIK